MSATPQTPDIKQLKARNRRRLIGAVAMVAALVVVLPMLLDKGPKPLKQDIAINIPAKEGADYTPLKPVTKPSDTKPVVAADAKPVEGQAVPNAPSLDVKRGAPQTPANDVVQGTKPGKSAVLKPMSKVIDPAGVVVTVAPTAAPTPAPTATPTPAPTKAVAPEKVAPTKFAVQIGVFSDPNNAKEIQAKLAVKGFKSTAEKLADGKIRVRIFGYATRDEADKALPSIHEVAKNAMAINL